jgi:hypothetical protein
MVDSVSRHTERGADLGDNMFGGLVAMAPKKKKMGAAMMLGCGANPRDEGAAPLMSMREREHYANQSDETMNEKIGGTLRNALSWVLDNPKKAVCAGISAAGLLALSKNRPKSIPNEVYMYGLPIGTSDFFGSGVYSEAQQIRQPS